MLDIIVLREAEADIAESYDWYNGRDFGRGEDFVFCVDECLRTVQIHPHIFPVAALDFRRALIRRYPFEIIYQPTDKAIIVYSVFHCSQNPDRWKNRIGLQSTGKQLF